MRIRPNTIGESVVMTSLAEDEYFQPSSRAEFWYKRAKSGYVTFEGDKAKSMNQAALWLPEIDLDSLDIAWDLVALENGSDAGLD